MMEKIQIIPLGYKQTEIGMIPVDWDVKKLGEIGETYGGLSGKTKNDFDEGKYPYIPFMNIMSNPVIDLQYFDYVKIRSDEKQNKAIKGDLFFNGSSETPEEVGMCSVLQGDILNLYLNSFCFGFRLNKNLKTSGLYFSYFFRSPMGRQLIFSLAQGATRYNLSKTNFMKLEIPYPEPVEQTAIATVLSETDASIEHLEKLIAKKKAIKQGAMQQLLTGKKRLPGFSGEWEMKKLGDFLDYEQPTDYLVSDTEYNDNNQTPVLTAGKTFILGYTIEEYRLFTNLPVIIFDDFTTAIKFVDFPFKAKSSAMKMLVPKGNNINLRFVYEKMLQIKFPLGDHKRHWIGEYQYLKIDVPTDPEEQTAIATVLSDMDAEIESLEQKRNKYTMLKQGMMQQLLTGRIRLI